MTQFWTCPKCKQTVDGNLSNTVCPHCKAIRKGVDLTKPI